LAGWASPVDLLLVFKRKFFLIVDLADRRDLPSWQLRREPTSGLVTYRQHHIRVNYNNYKVRPKGEQLLHCVVHDD
jgi:hypothetical protein